MAVTKYLRGMTEELRIIWAPWCQKLGVFAACPGASRSVVRQSNMAEGVEE